MNADVSDSLIVDLYRTIKGTIEVKGLTLCHLKSHLREIPSRGGKLAKNQQRTPKMVFFSYDIKNELESAKLWLVKPAGGKNSSQIWFYFRAL